MLWCKRNLVYVIRVGSLIIITWIYGYLRHWAGCKIPNRWPIVFINCKATLR